MKKYVLIGVLILLNLRSNSQITNINSYNELVAFQKDMQSETKMVVVWGYFGSWGKYNDIHKFRCKENLQSKDFSKITTCLSFKLFSDSAI